MVSKIKDGLFLGDVEASQDPEFIELNKITRIVNCATGQVRVGAAPDSTPPTVSSHPVTESLSSHWLLCVQAPNLWAQHGVRYLNLNWDEEGDYVVLEANSMLLKQVP